jgi:hypothetical protein
VNELRRWSEEGATTDEISVLEASRRERAPSNARVRTLKTLGIAAALTTVVTTTAARGTATTAAATAAAATRGGLGVLTKILVVSLLGGGIVTGGFLVRESSGETLGPSRRAAVFPRTGIVCPAR